MRHPEMRRAERRRAAMKCSTIDRTMKDRINNQANKRKRRQHGQWFDLQLFSGGEWRKMYAESADIEAVLWDKDGTILDFNYMWLNWCREIIHLGEKEFPALNMKELLKAWGVDTDRERIDYHGLLAIGSSREIREKLAEHVLFASENITRERANAFVDQAVSKATQSIEEKNWIKPVEGVPDVIARLSYQGFSQAVVTTDNTNEAYKHVKHLGLEQYFNAILGCDLVTNCKPAPDLILTACHRLQTQPSKAMVIGDTPADMQMGKNAGVACCVGVTSGVTPKAYLQKEADYVLASAGRLLD